MKTFRHAFEVCCAILALTLISLFCAYAWPDSKYGLASWVQAIGSISAILAAIGIANRQHRETLSLEFRRGLSARRDFLAGVIAVTTEAQRLLDAMPNEQTPEEKARHMLAGPLDLNSISDVHDALDKIHVVELRDARAIGSVFEVKRSLRGVQHDHKAAQMQIWANNAGWRNNAGEIGKRQKSVANANLILEQALAKLSLN